MIANHLVRWSALGHVAAFSAVDAGRYARGSRVVLRTGRGLELGEVLAPLAGDSSAPHEGTILRAMTEQDRLLEARLVKAADVLDLLVQVFALERAGASGLDEFWEVAEKPEFNLEGAAEQVVQELLQSILKARSELRNK